VGGGEHLHLDDEIFDVAAVEAGSWVPGPYGPDDELGSFNEVTDEVTRAALSLIDLSRPVKTYSLAEPLVNGYPAWGDRSYRQRLVVTGYQPPDGFGGEVVSTEPQGPGHNAVHEERIETSYSIGTKLNGLQHVGLGGAFYNGFRGVDIARTWGTTHLGNETMRPIVTRGVLIDVLGWKADLGGSEVVETPNGAIHLKSNYRITVDDLVSTLQWSGFSGELSAGDAVVIRTGWRSLMAEAPDEYLNGGPPGPYLRECRWLASFRPALVGSDTWCFEVLDRALTGGYLVPCHQELFMKYGIRIAESMPSDELAEDGVVTFVFCFTPQVALGATASNSPVLALAQPRRPT
jgi:kynurenine formamidase